MSMATSSRLPIMRQRPIVNRLFGAGLLLMALFSGAAKNAKGWFSFGGGGDHKVPIYVAADPRVAEQVTLNTGFASVAKAVTPAVVTVQTSSRTRRQQSPFFGDPFGPFGIDPFRDFYFRPNPPDEGGQQPRRQTPENRGRLQPSGLGSGVIVSPDGYILTNNHVIDGSEKVEVVLPDRRNFTAKVVGADPPSDIAVLKIEGSGFPTIPLGDSGKVEVGDGGRVG